jgi:hypothetical protein
MVGATDPEAPFRAISARDGAPRVASGTLEHFREKWKPVFRPKMPPMQEC